MKKIFTVAKVKNESDIIESFCRYNLTYCDGMLIQDNGSSDGTKQILQKLIDEGLPIYFTEGIGQSRRALLAIDEYDADLIVPLDADEFLYNIDGKNPRECLEALDETVEYQAIWRTYVYEKEPDISLGFMPNNFRYYRNSILEQYSNTRKVITSKFLMKNKHAVFVRGAHFLQYPIEFKNISNIQIHDKLVFAHFPLRSNYQIEIKTMANWIYKFGVSNHEPRERLDIYQIGMLFNHLKKYGEFKKEDIKNFSIIYAIITSKENNLTKDGLNEILTKLGNSRTIYDPMKTSFCNNKLELHYTSYVDHKSVFFRILLNEIDNTIMLLDRESSERSKKINELVSSRSWRFTKPFRACGSFIRDNKILYFLAKRIISIKRNGFNL